MGWAKYAEDNMEIFNNRMYERGIGFPNKSVAEFQRRIVYTESIFVREEEYTLVLKELMKIERWQEMVKTLYDFASSNVFIQLLQDQNSSLQKNKSEFINYRYSPRFKEYYDKPYVIEDDFMEELEMKLEWSYLDYFIEKIRGMKNISGDDAIQLNRVTWDLKGFLKKQLSLDVDALNKPIIQYVREDFIGDGAKPMIVCQHCSNNTYLDFETCIVCKYPNEVK